MHGTFGEDGGIQGVFEAFGIPYSDSNVLTSALAMDKMKSKILFEYAGLAVPKGAVVSIEDLKIGTCPIQKPFVIKPIAEGSTFGVGVIHNDDDLVKVLSQWDFGSQALVEAFD